MSILMHEDVHAMHHRLIPVNLYDARQRIVHLAARSTVGVFDKYCLFLFGELLHRLNEIPIEDVYHYTVDAPNEFVFNFERSRINVRT